VPDDLPLPDDVTDERVRDLPPAAEPTATITPYRDGPLIVRGEFRLVDTDGTEIDPGRKTVALCRCGKSGIKPFCDGTHKRAGFHAASGPVRPRPAAQLSEGPPAPHHSHARGGTLQGASDGHDAVPEG
jgi:CDGSH-type Zn-finger protein